jgi:folate-dependent tRNA-U54 methylase TrmFO/GidA
MWAALSLAGTMTGTSQYVSAAAFYCPAGIFKATLSGTPA